MRALRPLVCWLSWLGVGLSAQSGSAQAGELPRSLVADTLAVDVPTAFAPADFAAEDFSVERLSGDAQVQQVQQVQAQLVPGSLRWVRVAQFVVVPRALVVVTAKSAGAVAYAGFTHALLPAAPGDAGARAEIPVALFAGDTHPIDVELSGLGHARFAVRFTPRAEQRGRVMFDSSCSPFGLRVADGAIAADAYLHVGCRMIRTAREDDTAATLELYALWEQPGSPVLINGVRTDPRVDALYTVRASAKPNRLRLVTRGEALVLQYGLPDPVHAGFLGAGIGPYYYAYEDGPVELETMIPLLTVYAGYAFTPAIRVVYFNAAAIHRRGSIDQGLYVWFEQVRMLDDRVSLNLLLGANVLVYSHDDHVVGRFSVPQGFEFIVRDLFVRNRSLTAGAFLYPMISDRSYYNVWLRWGSPALFGELNYIEWQEPDGDEHTKSRAFGVSFGTPILRFF